MTTTDMKLTITGESLVASERVIQQIKELILSGELAAGERIRQQELAERFGTSRIPIREAIRYLESDGLVTLKSNSGAWVAKLDEAECLEVYKIRERIEPLAMMESLPNLTDEEIANLEELAERIELARSSEEFLRLDREFHLGSYAAAGMPELLRLINRYWNRTQQYRRAFTHLIGPQGRWIIHHEHRLMIEAFKRRDGEAAAGLVHAHIRRTRLALIESVRANLPPN